MLRTRLDAIRPACARAAEAARCRLDELTKPPGSLGRLEELTVRLAAIRGGPPLVERPVILTLAADHGVVDEAVSAYPQAVTAQMVRNFLAGGAAINVLAREAGATLVVADFGLVTPLAADPRLVVRRQGSGTANMARGPAMSRAQALAALEAGAALADEIVGGGADLLGTGEMGIGNTTAASAITAVLLGVPPETVTGPGTGLDAPRLAQKVDVVRRAIEVNGPDPGDPVDVLAKIGGFEIAGLAGAILAAAARRVPVALDGFIAGAAALSAVRLAPFARDALLASHRSAEPGHRLALADLGLVPYLDLGLRLGEGTGAALFVPLARAAARLYGGMATFASAGVSVAPSAVPSAAAPLSGPTPGVPAPSSSA